jgi:hypothetical protein
MPNGKPEANESAATHASLRRSGAAGALAEVVRAEP